MKKQEDLQNVEPYKILSKGTKWEKRLSKEQYDRRRENQKKYVKEHKKERAAYLKEYQKNYKVENPERALLAGARSNAQAAGREFTIDYRWLLKKLESGICSMTGIPFRYDGATNNYKPSIDRIDSELGYTKENCQLVCWAYNRAKSNMSDGEFYQLAQCTVDTHKANQKRIFNEDLIDE